MKKQAIKITIISLFMYIIFVVINSSVFAITSGDIFANDHGLFEPSKLILGVIKYGAVAVAVGAVMVKGIQYMLASPEGKADIKNQLILIVVGGILIFGTTHVIGLIRDLMM